MRIYFWGRKQQHDGAGFRFPPRPDNLKNLTRFLTPNHATLVLVLVTNIIGRGEVRHTRTGTLGWTPLENMLDDVVAAPDQDTFAVGVDVCFILARPDLKYDDASMFAHPVRGVSGAGRASVGL